MKNTSMSGYPVHCHKKVPTDIPYILTRFHHFQHQKSLTLHTISLTTQSRQNIISLLCGSDHLVLLLLSFLYLWSAQFLAKTKMTTSIYVVYGRRDRVTNLNDYLCAFITREHSHIKPLQF